MDIHINKKIAGLMIGSLLVGVLIGGAIGVMAGHEGHDGGERYGMRGDMFDNQSDGETNDDQGGLPNQDEQPTGMPVVPPTPVSAQ